MTNRAGSANSGSREEDEMTLKRRLSKLEAAYALVRNGLSGLAEEDTWAKFRESFEGRGIDFEEYLADPKKILRETCPAGPAPFLVRAAVACRRDLRSRGRPLALPLAGRGSVRPVDRFPPHGAPGCQGRKGISAAAARDHAALSAPYNQHRHGAQPCEGDRRDQRPARG